MTDKPRRRLRDKLIPWLPILAETGIGTLVTKIISAIWDKLFGKKEEKGNDAP